MILFILGQIASKFIGIYPVTKFFKSPPKEAFYTTLVMSTGLTFGTIAALFGLAHHIITQSQYSLLVAAVIGTAIIPTLVAILFFSLDTCWKITCYWKKRACLTRHLVPGLPRDNIWK